MSESETAAERILVIKHGALGDFILATGPFRAIRAHHLGARITLLTTPPFEGLGRECGFFDDVWVDSRPGPLQFGAWLELRRRLNGASFGRIYDLQTSGRTVWYYRLLASPRPDWSGHVPGCSHPHDNPDRDRMHTLERQAEQLRVASIDYIPPPDIAWLDAPVSGFELPAAFALLVPGGSRGRPSKRWPAAGYAALAQRLVALGVTPVLIGTTGESEVTARTADRCDEVIDLTDRTSLAEVAALCRLARISVGNDTGPMHISALTGCRTIVLFSHDSVPALCAPRGPGVVVIRRERLEDLAVDDVLRETGIPG